MRQLTMLALIPLFLSMSACKSEDTVSNTSPAIDRFDFISANSATTLVLDFTYLPIDPPIIVDPPIPRGRPIFVDPTIPLEPTIPIDPPILVDEAPIGIIASTVSIDLATGVATLNSNTLLSRTCTPSAATLAKLRDFRASVVFEPTGNTSCEAPTISGITNWTFLFPNDLSISRNDCPKTWDMAPADKQALDELVQGYYADCYISIDTF